MENITEVIFLSIMGRIKGITHQEARERLLSAVGRGFRTSGYGGAGVDGLAREAGLTSGAFYGHFSSKADAFQAAVVKGLQELQAGLIECQAQHGKNWVRAFAQFYLGFKRTCDLSSGCALPTFSTEVERAGPAVRAAYRGEMEKIIVTVAEGLPDQDIASRRKRAMGLLAILSGGVSISRALDHSGLAGEMAEATIQLAIAIAAEPEAVP